MILRANLKSRTLNRKTQITVILPVNQIHYLSNDENIVKKPFKTLYLLHPLFGDNESYLDNTNILNVAQQYNIAIVMPNCGNSYFLDNKETNEYFSKFVGKELVDVTRNAFNLSSKREDTFIGGFSMGGYGAILNGLKYAKTFGKIIAISPALLNSYVFNIPIDNVYLNNARKYSATNFKPFNEIEGSNKDFKVFLNKLLDNNEDIPKIFLSCGSSDFLFELSKLFDDYLNYKNVEHIFNIGKGEHSISYMNTFLNEIMEWLSE